MNNLKKLKNKNNRILAKQARSLEEKLGNFSKTLFCVLFYALLALVFVNCPSDGGSGNGGTGNGGSGNGGGNGNGGPGTVPSCVAPTTRAIASGDPSGDPDGDGTINSADTDDDNDGSLDTADVDDDGDGLIEIATLAELNNIRFDLDGTHYDDEVDDDTCGAGDATGCGGLNSITACSGYELVANLDFDTDGDGVTYTADTTAAGTATLIDDTATGDADDTYYGGGAGFVPIGSCNADNACDNPFTGTFEGNGNTIANLFIKPRWFFRALWHWSF